MLVGEGETDLVRIDRAADRDHLARRHDLAPGSAERCSMSRSISASVL